MSEPADSRSIRQRFDAAAELHDAHAALGTEVGARLLDRLEGLRFDPARIVDLGCATGRQAAALRQRFPQATITALDQSWPMLRQARRRRGRWRPRFDLVQGDFGQLPLADNSQDLVHACLSLQWRPDLPGTLAGIRRIMRPRGLVLLALPGPDTLVELRRCGITVDCGITTHAQALGDALIRAGFQEPVLDTDWLSLDYADLQCLLADLDHTGVGHVLPAAPETVAETLVEGSDGEGIRVTWEVLYATAWSPDQGQPIRTDQGEEASFPVTSLGIRRRGN